MKNLQQKNKVSQNIKKNKKNMRNNNHLAQRIAGSVDNYQLCFVIKLAS